jgi:hypothetical protein
MSALARIRAHGFREPWNADLEDGPLQGQLGLFNGDGMSARWYCWHCLAVSDG